MRRLQEQFGTAIILITHDLGVVAEMADEVVVMYAGAVMERAPRRDIFYRNHHPYTQGPAGLPAGPAAGEPADPDPGHAAEPDQRCRPGARSRRAARTCSTSAAPRPPPLTDVGGDPRHQSACWLPHDASEAMAS